METVSITVTIKLQAHMAQFIRSMIRDKRAPWVILGYILKHIDNRNGSVNLGGE